MRRKKQTCFNVRGAYIVTMYVCKYMFNNTWSALLYLVKMFQCQNNFANVNAYFIFRKLFTQIQMRKQFTAVHVICKIDIILRIQRKFCIHIHGTGNMYASTVINDISDISISWYISKAVKTLVFLALVRYCAYLFVLSIFCSFLSRLFTLFIAALKLESFFFLLKVTQN